MNISLIVAMDRRRLIGNEHGLPWHLPADLKRFRKLTTGKPIIMGRKTFEHIGKPLPDRLNIVVTRQIDYVANGCSMAHSVDDALAAAAAALDRLGGDEIMVIGGADVFQQAMPRADRIYLTIVEGDFVGNAFFPAGAPFRGLVIKQEELQADEKNRHAQRFFILERREQGMSIDELLESSGPA